MGEGTVRRRGALSQMGTTAARLLGGQEVGGGRDPDALRTFFQDHGESTTSNGLRVIRRTFDPVTAYPFDLTVDLNPDGELGGTWLVDGGAILHADYMYEPAGRLTITVAGLGDSRPGPFDLSAGGEIPIPIAARSVPADAMTVSVSFTPTSGLADAVGVTLTLSVNATYLGVETDET